MFVNKEEKFEIKKGSRFLLYGAASSGTLLYEKLQSSDFFVEGFIDKRADEITELKGKRVYSVREAADCFPVSDIIVIISIKNVFEHSKIAEELYRNGFTNILYKPYTVLNGTGSEEEKKISQAYDDILCGNFTYGLSIVCKHGTESFVQLTEKYMLKKGQDSDVVLLSMLSLFENINSDTEAQERNVLFFFPHIQFFKYLQGNTSSSSEYYVKYCEMAAEEINSFAITDAWKENVIRNRTQIFEEMNQAYIFNRDFFQTGAPEVVWNDKGYLNLVSGKHRAAFFASKGIGYLPVKISHVDIHKWLNREAAEKLRKILEEKGILELKAPVEHPFFYQYPCNARSFFYGACFALAEKISRLYYVTPLDNYIYRKSMYLSVDDYGLMARFFARAGAVVCEEKNGNMEISEALDELFYMEGNKRRKKKEKYDIAVVKADCRNDIKIRLSSIKAKYWFFVGPLSLVSEERKLKCIYNGVAWEQQTAVGYMEMQDV